MSFELFIAIIKFKLEWKMSLKKKNFFKKKLYFLKI